MRRGEKRAYQVTLLAADELAGCRERALAEARNGRTRYLSREWIETEQKETENAFREGREFHVALPMTREELIRLEELKWLPFKRHPRYNVIGGWRLRLWRSKARPGPRRAPLWVYWAEDSTSPDPGGPVAFGVLLDMILSRRMSEQVVVAPAKVIGNWSRRSAVDWPQFARRLPLNLPELCRVWVRASSRQKWPKRDWWAWEKATREIEISGDRGWRVICALVAAAPSRAVLGNIGAGYLEDFIQNYPEYRDRVVARAKRDKKFRRSLSSAYRTYMTREMMDVVDRG